MTILQIFISKPNFLKVLMDCLVSYKLVIVVNRSNVHLRVENNELVIQARCTHPKETHLRDKYGLSFGATSSLAYKWHIPERCNKESIRAWLAGNTLMINIPKYDSIPSSRDIKID
jgi:HSP20 family molecular chaperone IbpA